MVNGPWLSLPKARSVAVSSKVLARPKDAAEPSNSGKNSVSWPSLCRREAVTRASPSGSKRWPRLTFKPAEVQE